MEWEPARAMHLARARVGALCSKRLGEFSYIGSVVLDSGRNSPVGMLHASKGIADVSG
jgi:hypothetical protein